MRRPGDGLDGAAMCFNNRPADRKAHTHTIRLCRIKRLKEFGHIRFGESAAGILDSDLDVVGSVASSVYDEFTLSVRDIGQRVGRIVDQTERELLQLYSVAVN